MAYGWWVCALPFYGVAFLFVPIVVLLALPVALLRVRMTDSVCWR